MAETTGGAPMFEQPDFGVAEGGDFDDEESGDEVGDDVSAEVGRGHDDSARRAGEGGAARAVLELVTAALVDDESAIVIETSEVRSGTRFAVHVAPGDMGRVIGRRGRTVQALRTLVRAAAASEGRDASVEVVD